MNDQLSQDKIDRVTGSSRGIGRVIADHLASLGAQVAMHGTTLYSTRAFNEADFLAAVAQEIGPKYNRTILPVTGDLAQETTVQSTGKTIPRHSVVRRQSSLMKGSAYGNLGCTRLQPTAAHAVGIDCR